MSSSSFGPSTPSSAFATFSFNRFSTGPTLPGRRPSQWKRLRLGRSLFEHPLGGFEEEPEGFDSVGDDTGAGFLEGFPQMTGA